MRNRKNVVLTFFCSLIPGAGEMYMGFYKQGISLMGLFFAALVIGEWSRMEILWAVLPVIWFFSFFHTHNLRSLSPEEFLKQEDRYFVLNEVHFDDADVFFKKNKKVIALALVFWGICMLTQICMDLLNPFFSGFLWELAWRFNNHAARIIVALGVVLGGFHLLKKRETARQEEEETADEDKLEEV